MSKGNGVPLTGVVVTQRCLDVDTDFDDILGIEQVALSEDRSP